MVLWWLGEGEGMPRVEAKESRAGTARLTEIDRHVGRRIRERRMTLGLTQQQLAELIGVTYQQAHKYEVGKNRMSAGRLVHIAKALEVELEHFFHGLGPVRSAELSPQRRLLLELTRNFMKISSLAHQEALCAMARAMASAQKDGPESHEGER